MTGKQSYMLSSMTYFLLILRFCSISNDFFKEPEYMNGEEFLRSVEARLVRMAIANAFHDYQTENFRRELEDKQLRASIAKVRVIT